MLVKIELNSISRKHEIKEVFLKKFHCLTFINMVHFIPINKALLNKAFMLVFICSDFLP